MKTKIFRIFIVMICALIFTGAAQARDVKFEVELDRNKVSIGDTAELGLSFYGTQGMPAPDIGQIEGLEIRYIGPSTMLTVINGQVSSSVTHRYTIQPLKIGKFQIGPFSFRYKGDEYSSNMVFLESVEEKVPKFQPAQQAAPEEKVDIEDRAFLRLDVGKAAAYVNELIPVSVKLYSRIPLSEIQLPTFDQESFSKAEFKDAKQYRDYVDGAAYDVLEFKTNILGTRPGDYRIGPAKIKCNMIKRKSLRGRTVRDDFYDDDSYRDSFFDDFFTRYERHPIELKSQDVKLIISPLPIDNVPKDFEGAVGDYQFIYNASPTKVKAGDPITVRMSVNGTGNFNTVFSPKMKNTDGFRLYEPQVKTEENSKTFTQVLIPENEQIKAIPEASFTFFDPNKREYRRITQGPIQLTVEKPKEEAPSQVIGPAMQAVQTMPKEEELARDIIYIKESPGRWLKINYQVYKSKLFLLLIILPLIALIALYAVQERKSRLKRDTAYAGRVFAYRVAHKGTAGLKHKLKSQDARSYYEELFKVLQDYLGNRVQVPTGGITADIVDHVLAPKNIDMDILRKVRQLFETCDRVRFSSLEVDKFKMKDDLLELKEIIDYFERMKA